MRGTLKRLRGSTSVLVAVMVLLAPLAVAQQRPVTKVTWETAENPSVILVQNARIWTQGPAGILESADMLVSDGKIAEIGSNLSAPAGAMVIDGTG